MKRSLILAALLVGCASPPIDFLTMTPPPAPNPAGEGIPVSQLSSEILGPSKDDMRTISLTKLRQRPVKEHLVGPGDTLGIWIDGILGEKDNRAAPLNQREIENASIKPEVGYPILVTQDGKIELPYVVPISVDKKTLSEVRDLIRATYSGGRNPIFTKGDERVFVSLTEPRRIRVQVIRDGSIIGAAGGSQQLPTQALELPVYDNDILHVLDHTGGVPNLDAVKGIVIERAKPGDGTRGIRIPTRLRKDEKIPFTEDDIILQNGDVVYVVARDTEVYYTGGLLQSKQIVLPRDYDLHAIEAVALANCPFRTGSPDPNDLSGGLLNEGIGNSADQLSVIRQTKDHGLITIRVDLKKAFDDPRENIIIQPGDFLILQDSHDEVSAFARTSRYLRSMFSTDFLRERYGSGPLISEGP